jgi:RNA recognition motif-containing protein
MSKIYVGNCSFDVTEQQLRDVFAAYGDVASVSVITDRDTGRPRGFAFIEMNDAQGRSIFGAIDQEIVRFG